MNKPAICLALAMVSSATLAGEAAPVLDRLVDCASFTSASDRLSCFDREIAPLAKERAAARNGSAPLPARPATAAPAAPAVASTPALPAAPARVPAPAPVAPSKPSFGQEQLPTAADRPPVDAEVLHARIAAKRKGGSSTFLVTLDNGQVWRHENEFQGDFLVVGEAVTITKGTLGTYRLTRDAGAEKNWIRVTRIR